MAVFLAFAGDLPGRCALSDAPLDFVASLIAKGLQMQKEAEAKLDVTQRASGFSRSSNSEFAAVFHKFHSDESDPNAFIRKRQHNELANHLLTLGDRFYVEDMEWPTLTHRAKKTEISEKTGRYKRKKRFGKSVANKAPAMLIGLLDLKLKSRGLEGVVKVNTNVRASQYNHMTDDYHKKELRERWNKMPDGRRVQRDLYSAFLLQHMNENRDGFDKEALRRDYEQFTALHDQCIEELKTAEKTLASMGIVRRAS